MKRSLMYAVTVIALVLVAVPQAPARETPDTDRAGAVAPGTVFKWAGREASGANLHYGDNHVCADSPDTQCESVLIAFNNPMTRAETAAGMTAKTADATIEIAGTGPGPVDFDLYVYASDATGRRGDPLSDSVRPTAKESVTTTIETTADEPTVFIRAEVVYYTVPRGGYTGKAALASGTRTQAISMQGCHMTLHLFKDSAERLSKWVPDTDRYRMTGTVPGRPDQAWLAFWFYACRDVAINGGAPRPAKLSLVGIVVKKPQERGGQPIHEDPSWSGPVDSDHYLVWAHTDHRKLARSLRRVGMPVEKVGQIEFERPNDFDALASVVSSDGSYSAMVHGTHDDSPHWHDNSFWHHDPRFGDTQLRLQIGSSEHPIADDWSCKSFFFAQEVPTPCSSVTAEHGTPVASLLGASTRDDSFAANHLQFDATGSISSYDVENAGSQ